MADPCCQTAEDGTTSCALPARDAAQEQDAPHLWRRFRSGVMFAVACLASPCCTPLYVPLVVALLAGTPVAGWVALQVGWLYGALTALSLLSGGVGLYWMRGRRSLPAARPDRACQPEATALPRLNEG